MVEVHDEEGVVDVDSVSAVFFHVDDYSHQLLKRPGRQVAVVPCLVESLLV